MCTKGYLEMLKTFYIWEKMNVYNDEYTVVQKSICQSALKTKGMLYFYSNE